MMGKARVLILLQREEERESASDSAESVAISYFDSASIALFISYSRLHLMAEVVVSISLNTVGKS
jgi:hypothetical protein